MTINLRPEALENLVARVLAANGMSGDNARIVAAVVAAAERDGARSHGLFRIPGYIGTLRSGWVNGNSVPDVKDAAPGVVATDADNGYSQVALAASRPLLLEKARRNGIALLAIRNSHHFAALWPDVEPFAAAGFLALSFVNTRSRVAPWGAAKRLLGTNPMAFACPRPNAPPMVWDQASSVTAMGEVMLAAQDGHAVGDSVGIDAEGRPTTDPKAIMAGGALLPFGGHKGSAIAAMVEILAAALTGGRFGFEDSSAKYPGAESSNAGQSIVLVDPSATAGTAFAGRVDELFSRLMSVGVSRLPGDRRYAARRKADREGILVEQKTYDYLRSLLPPGDPEHRREGSAGR
jgi:delta1-piperideine-2-carboxylate reductase